jgi:hypothetical protein
MKRRLTILQLAALAYLTVGAFAVSVAVLLLPVAVALYIIAALR